MATILDEQFDQDEELRLVAKKKPIKTCVFCGKKRPYNYRKLKWRGVRYGKGPSYWVCSECDKDNNLNRYAEVLEERRVGDR